jgi:hypothetical protein
MAINYFLNFQNIFLFFQKLVIQFSSIKRNSFPFPNPLGPRSSTRLTFSSACTSAQFPSLCLNTCACSAVPAGPRGHRPLMQASTPGHSKISTRVHMEHATHVPSLLLANTSPLAIFFSLCRLPPRTRKAC